VFVDASLPQDRRRHRYHEREIVVGLVVEELVTKAVGGKRGSMS
jgi:hypothetical protein